MSSKRLGFLAGAVLVLAGGRFSALFSQTGCYIRLTGDDYVAVSYTGAGYVEVGVTTDPSCQWRASASDSWFRVRKVSNPATGDPPPPFPTNQGSGTLTMEVDPNDLTDRRIGTVTIASVSESKTLEVRQGAHPIVEPPIPPPDACPVTLSTSVPPLSKEGTTGFNQYLHVSVTKPAGCSWHAVTPHPWIAFRNNTQDSGENEVVMMIGANPGNDRVGTVVVATNSASATLQLRQPGYGLPSGPMTTLAGAPVIFRGDGLPATQSALGEVDDVAIDNLGNLFFPLHDFHQIARLSPNGILNIIGGNGIPGLSGEGGKAVNASMSSPRSVAVDALGNIFVAESNRLRKIDANNNITTLAQFDSVSPTKLLSNGAAGIQVATDGFTSQIAQFSPGQPAKTVVPTVIGDSGSRLKEPYGLAADSQGLIFSDRYTGYVYRWQNGQAKVIAGGGTSTAEGVSGPSASLSSPYGVAVLGSQIVVAESGRNRLRGIRPDGTIQTLAGTGTAGFGGDGGPSKNAQFRGPRGIAADAQGNLFVADTGNRRVRQIAPGGDIRTVAGDGRATFSLDGQLGIDIELPAFRIGVDPKGSAVYISDSANHRVLLLDGNGKVHVIAGNGTAGVSGDGGPAESASLDTPGDVAVGPDGAVYVADTGNRRVRKIAGGRITTIATNLWANDLSVDPNGNVFVAPYQVEYQPAFFGSGDGRFVYIVRVIRPDGSTANLLELQSRPAGMAVDSAGYLYLSEVDSQNTSVPAAITRRRVQVTASEVKVAAPDLSIGFDATYESPAGLAVLPTGRGIAAKAGYGVVFIVDGRLPGGVGASYSAVGFNGATYRPDLNVFTSFFGADDIGMDGSGNLYLADNANHHLLQILNTLSTPAALASIKTPLPIRLNGFSGGPPVRGTFLLEAPHPASGSDLGLNFIAGSGEPAWLHLAPTDQDPGAPPTLPFLGVTPRTVEVFADPAHLSPGVYKTNVSVTVDSVVFGDGAPVAAVPIEFSVTGKRAADFSLDRERLDFAYTAGGTPRAEVIVISNTGSGSIGFKVAASGRTDSGVDWLSASPTQGTATPATPATVTVVAKPTGLRAGTYTGRITVTSPDTERKVEVPVTMTVSASGQVLRLSQSGLSFVTVAAAARSAAPVVPPQTFGVLNLGRDRMNWSVTAETASGGNWLKVKPADCSKSAEACANTGLTDAGSPAPSIQVSVDQGNLPPGDYHGILVVRAPNSANRAQLVTVYLKVLAPQEKARSLVDPAELFFKTQIGVNPSSQDVLVYNVSAQARTFQTGFFSSWLHLSAPEGTLDPLKPFRIAVGPAGFEGWPPGQYEDTITFRFSDGSTQNVKVRYVLTDSNGVVPLSNGTAQSVKVRSAVTGSKGAVPLAEDGNTGPSCAPKPLLTSQALSSTPEGWPVALQARVIDECGAPMADGSVFVRFSNGDPELQLQSLRNGLWEGTWTARPDTINGSVTATVTATNSVKQSRSETFSLTMNGAGEKPVTSREKIVSVASLEASSLAPGSRIVITGELLAGGSYSATAPLPDRLPAAGDGETTIVNITGFDGGDGLFKLKLEQVDKGRIVAIVPNEVPIDTIHQILVRRGSARSQPVYVAVAGAQPAIYKMEGATALQGDVSVEGAGAATPATPAHVNDTILIHCSGLGATDPPVDAGTIAPNGATVSGVEVLIDGVPVPGDAQLIPGQVGHYRVRAVIPQGVTPGNAVEVKVKASGQSSAAVTIAIAN